MAVYEPADARQIPSICTTGFTEYAVPSQPAAENSIGNNKCHLRSCLRSERRPHQIIAMIVQTCGIAASRPMLRLLAPPLKLFTISGVQTATIARVLTRQK